MKSKIVKNYLVTFKNMFYAFSCEVSLNDEAKSGMIDVPRDATVGASGI